MKQWTDLSYADIVNNIMVLLGGGQQLLTAQIIYLHSNKIGEVLLKEHSDFICVFR